jgi:hypothetical protein
MAQHDLVDLRLQAERAVADMPEGDLKVKAFEVLLNHLLTTADRDGDGEKSTRRVAKGQPSTGTSVGNSKAHRILALKNDGFFGAQRTISEVREELASHGWHYPVTGLSGPLQELVQRRQLRRQRMVDGKKKLWKYSNP